MDKYSKISSAYEDILLVPSGETMHVRRGCLTACAEASTEKAGGPGPVCAAQTLQCRDGRVEGVRRDHYRVNAGKANMFFLLH